MSYKNVGIDQRHDAHFLHREFLHFLVSRLALVLRRAFLGLIEKRVHFRTAAFLHVDGHAAFIVVRDEVVGIGQRAHPIHGGDVELARSPYFIPVAGNLHRSDIGFDADRGEVGLNDRRHRHHCGKGRGHGHRCLEAIRETGLGQQLFCAFDVRALFKEGDVGVAPVPFRNHASDDRRRLAEKRPRDQRLAVKSKADGLPHLGIVERFVLVVGQKPIVARPFDGLGNEFRIARHSSPVLGRDFIGEIHLPRHHGVRQRGDI